jgi:uncharacterized protein
MMRADEAGSLQPLALALQLAGMVRASASLMAALRAARGLGLASWCIGAGAVRSAVWDALHGFTAPSRLDDVDLVYFELPAQPGRDAALERDLRRALPGVAWEVTNQATVHEWFRDALQMRVEPLLSLEAGVATWPEYATCVGVTLNADDSIVVIAPHGLDDLFALRLRHNPSRADAATYRQRLNSKRFTERWPLVTAD